MSNDDDTKAGWDLGRSQVEYSIIANRMLQNRLSLDRGLARYDDGMRKPGDYNIIMTKENGGKRDGRSAIAVLK